MLAGRIVPEYEIDFVQIQDTVDVFELQTVDDRLVIKGNNANSMAVGLNHYLKNYCDVTVSWYAYDPVQYPSVMPQVKEPVRVEARVKERFSLIIVHSAILCLSQIQVRRLYGRMYGVSTA